MAFRILTRHPRRKRQRGLAALEPSFGRVTSENDALRSIKDTISRGAVL